MKNKYNAKKATVDGITFDSRKEAEYYLVLKDMQMRGEIKNFVLQPSWIILPKLTRDGITLRAKRYTADFAFTKWLDNGTTETTVVEVKSPITAKARDYALRKHLFLAQHPEYKFLEVGT